MRKLIVHIDVDAFAVSVARALNPSLCGRPVVVGNEAGGRGLVACASYEAREFGIQSGMPLILARRRAPAAIILATDPMAQRHFSERLFELLRDSAPMAEMASLDDVYLDITGCEGLFGNNLLNWMSQLGRRIRGETGLPVSMGLGSNKLIARAATWLAKPSHALMVIPGAEHQFLSDVPIGRLPGIGAAMSKRLHEYGVGNVGQLAALGEERLRLLFGRAGEKLWYCAQGHWPEPVMPTTLHQHLVYGHMFDQDTVNLDTLQAAAARLVERIAWHLRHHHLRCQGVELILTYSDGRTVTRVGAITCPTHSETILCPVVQAALRAAFGRRVRVRKIQLCARYEVGAGGQFDFFDEHAQQRERNLHQAIDLVRTRHGLASLISATSLDPVARRNR